MYFIHFYIFCQIVFAQINNSMDFTTFAHGQIKSKIWLCETLEPILPKNAKIAILGSWYNLLGFMLLIRKNAQIHKITGVDLDTEAIEIADKVCDMWKIESNLVTNIAMDACDFDLSGYDVIINCSVEHIDSDKWFENIKPGTLVCLQSSDVTDQYKDNLWHIVNPNHNLEEFKNKYPLSHTIFNDELKIEYDTWGYKRLMLIGIK